MTRTEKSLSHCDLLPLTDSKQFVCACSGSLLIVLCLTLIFTGVLMPLVYDRKNISEKVGNDSCTYVI